MGFGKWLSDRWGRGPSMKGLRSSVRGTGRFLDNDLVRTAAGLALTSTGIGAIPGAAIMAGGTAATKLARGKNIGEALGSGAKVGAGYGAARAISAGADKLMNRGAAAASSSAPGGVKGVPTDVLSPEEIEGALNAAKSVPGPMDLNLEGDVLSRFGVRQAGNWLKKNPKDAMILGGKAAGGIMEHRQNASALDLQRQELELVRQRDEEERERRRKIGAAVSPHMQQMLADLLARFGAQQGAPPPMNA
jgi:hypothetical protein